MRVKERHRGEEELQEGCVSFRLSNRSGKGATPVSPASGLVSRLWLEDRQATGRDQKKKKESYERCAWKDKAGIRGVQAGKQRSCSVLHPRNATDVKLGAVGQTQDEAASLASQPGAKRVTGVSKPLTQKHFSAIPQKAKPRALGLVFCARLCPLCTPTGHRGRAREAAPAAWSAASMGRTWLTHSTGAHVPPRASMPARGRATTQRGLASPKSSWTEDLHCWGVKTSVLDLNTSHRAAALFSLQGEGTSGPPKSFLLEITVI